MVNWRWTVERTVSIISEVVSKQHNLENQMLKFNLIVTYIPRYYNTSYQQALVKITGKIIPTQLQNGLIMLKSVRPSLRGRNLKLATRPTFNTRQELSTENISRRSVVYRVEVRSDGCTSNNLTFPSRSIPSLSVAGEAVAKKDVGKTQKGVPRCRSSWKERGHSWEDPGSMLCVSWVRAHAGRMKRAIYFQVRQGKGFTSLHHPTI